jgi:hypothetical protein
MIARARRADVFAAGAILRALKKRPAIRGMRARARGANGSLTMFLRGGQAHAA